MGDVSVKVDFLLVDLLFVESLFFGEGERFFIVFRPEIQLGDRNNEGQNQQDIQGVVRGPDSTLAG